MAAVFDLDTERDARSGETTGARGGAGFDRALQIMADHIRGLDPDDALARIRRGQAVFTAAEAEVLAKLTRQTGGDRAAKRALRDGKTSKAAINKAVKRGAAAAANPGLIDKAAAEGLSEEQFDVIADTAAKTDGAAAVDDDFIAEVAAVDPDQAKAVVAKFIDSRTDPDGRQSEHDRQRRLRRAFKYNSKKDNLDTISICGDGIAIRNMWDAINARSDDLYKVDGGRDTKLGKHPRTNDQRKFDAAHELICGITTTPTGTINQPRSTDQEPADRGDTGDIDPDSEPPKPPKRTRTKPARPQIFVGLTLDHYVGNDPAAIAEQIGLGLIPDSVLADYLACGEIIAIIYDHHGEPLWLKRLKRNATMFQRFALIARDKACVLCGAPHQQCEVHHLLPWEAPARGETNLDNLALLCGSCHRQLHADNHTLYRDQHRRWRTRPALAHESPPKRVDYPQRE